MSDNIREWAKANGHEIGASGPIPRSVRQAYQARETVEAEAFPADVQSSEPDTEPAPPAKASTETAPRQPKLGDRVKQSLDTSKSRAKRVRKPRVEKPKGPRVSIEAILTGAWAAVAGGVGKINPPVGYIMAHQAPVAGMLMEDSVKGTMVDHLLQPLAKNADRARTAKALIGPPVIVAMLQAQPDKAPFLIPILRKMLADYIDLAGPKMLEIAAREKQFEDKYGEQLDEIINGLITVINITNAQAAEMNQQGE